MQPPFFARLSALSLLENRAFFVVDNIRTYVLYRQHLSNSCNAYGVLVNSDFTGVVTATDEVIPLPSWPK